jgi:hypothetical protein
MAKRRKISANLETYLANLQSFLTDIDQQKTVIASDIASLEKSLNSVIETKRKNNGGAIDEDYELSKKFELFDKKMAAMRNLTSLLQEESKALGKHSDFIKTTVPQGGGETPEDHKSKEGNSRDLMNKIHEAVKSGSNDDEPKYEER